MIFIKGILSIRKLRFITTITGENMKRSKQVIKELKTHISKNTDRAPTNYRVAKMLETSPTAIDNCTKKGAILTDTCLIKAAKILGYAPTYLLISACIERGLLQSECKTEWREIQKKLDLFNLKRERPTAPKKAKK